MSLSRPAILRENAGLERSRERRRCPISTAVTALQVSRGGPSAPLLEKAVKDYTIAARLAPAT